jgi:hypothetical protein
VTSVIVVGDISKEAVITKLGFLKSWKAKEVSLPELNEEELPKYEKTKVYVVHQSDYLIVKWDESVFRGGGTHGEVTMAYWLGKPVFLVNRLPIDDISSWIFSCSEHIFDNFEDLKKKLEELYC